MANPILEAARDLATVYESQTEIYQSVNKALRCGDYQERDRLADWTDLVDFVDVVVDSHRNNLINSIDEWVDLVTPAPSPKAPLHSETVGHVVDRLALLTVKSYAAFSNEPASVAKAVHCKLDLLATAYQDLIRELAAGSRRIPNHTQVSRGHPAE